MLLSSLHYDDSAIKNLWKSQSSEDDDELQWQKDKLEHLTSKIMGILFIKIVKYIVMDEKTKWYTLLEDPMSNGLYYSTIIVADKLDKI